MATEHILWSASGYNKKDPDNFILISGVGEPVELSDLVRLKTGNGEIGEELGHFRSIRWRHRHLQLLLSQLSRKPRLVFS